VVELEASQSKALLASPSKEHIAKQKQIVELEKGIAKTKKVLEKKKMSHMILVKQNSLKKEENK